MKTAWTERVREQLDRPLTSRSLLFVFLSLLIALPLSFVWAGAAAVRMKRRSKGALGPKNNEPWIVSVGNVAVGGMGKSPIVRALARMALSEGFDVAILTRGVAAQANVPRVGCIAEGADFWSQDWSDETLEHAVLLGARLDEGPRVWLGQGGDRGQVFEMLMYRRKQRTLSGEKLSSFSSSPPGFENAAGDRPLLVLLDDGLSQTALRVHRDVVVWDPQSLLSAPRVCLPFGPYRMGWPGPFWSNSLPVADLIVWSRLVDLNQMSLFRKTIHKAQDMLNARTEKNWIACEQVNLSKVILADSGGGFFLEDVTVEQITSPYAVLLGLARPHRFLETLGLLKANGSPAFIKVLQTPEQVITLKDHGQLNGKARALLQSRHPLLTSLKDVCRWWKDDGFKAKILRNEIYVLRLGVHFKKLQDEASELCFSDIINRD
jgi:tetraacyldisaccharide-1-P 4'-kinase